MKTLFLIFGALSFGLLVFLVGFWYGQPLLSRQFVLRRLNRTKINKGVGVKQSHEPDRLTDLSELLDSTARHLRLGKSLASAFKPQPRQIACLTKLLAISLWQPAMVRLLVTQLSVF